MKPLDKSSTEIVHPEEEEEESKEEARYKYFLMCCLEEFETRRIKEHVEREYS